MSFCSHEQQQLSRLMERNSLSTDDAVARIKSQLPLTEKCKMSTYVIDNCGSIEETREQAKNVYQKLQASRRHLIPWIALLALLAAVVVGASFLLWWIELQREWAIYFLVRVELFTCLLTLWCGLSTKEYWKEYIFLCTFLWNKFRRKDTASRSSVVKSQARSLGKRNLS